MSTPTIDMETQIADLRADMNQWHDETQGWAAVAIESRNLAHSSGEVYKEIVKDLKETRLGVGAVADEVGVVQGQLGTLDGRFSVLEGKLSSLGFQFGAMDTVQKHQTIVLETIEKRLENQTDQLDHQRQILTTHGRTLNEHGKVLRSLDSKVGSLDSKVGSLDSKVESLDSKVDQILELLKN